MMITCCHSYHHNAYFVQQAGEVVRMDSDRFVDYIDAMFTSQDGKNITLDYMYMTWCHTVSHIDYDPQISYLVLRT